MLYARKARKASGSLSSRNPRNLSSNPSLIKSLLPNMRRTAF